MDRDTSINENAPDIVEALLHARYSCRAYKPDPVPQATIERIVALRRKAGLAMTGVLIIDRSRPTRSPSSL